MNPFFKAIDSVISWWCHTVLYITLSVVFVILSVNVCLRYAAGTSLSWASELPELMFPWMIMSGVVIAAQHGSHIAVVLLTQKLGAARRWVLTGASLVVGRFVFGFGLLPLGPCLKLLRTSVRPSCKYQAQ